MEQVFEIDGEIVGKLGINPNNDQVSIMNSDNSNSVNPSGFLVTNPENQTRNIDFSWIGLKINEDLSSEAEENKLLFAQRAYCEKPQTLINTLNNCDDAQLEDIRRLLFPISNYTDTELATILHAQSLLVSKGLRDEASKIGAPRPRG